MKGDFSRDTYRQKNLSVQDDPQAPSPGRVRELALRERRYARVLQQQGRVQLDADWNEQVAITTYLLRRYMADVVGRHGTPSNDKVFKGGSFAIAQATASNAPPGGVAGDIVIMPGRYYVEGVLCESSKIVLFKDQPDRVDVNQSFANGGNWLFYLDVWERHVTEVEDDYLREVALGGPDTASRAQVVWQVFAKPLDQKQVNSLTKDGQPPSGQDPADPDKVMALLDTLTQRSGAVPLLRARANPPDPEQPCVSSPDAKYRGPENQLYRVEVHDASAAGTAPTFKWSRDNGSTVFPIVAEGIDTDTDTAVVTVEHLGRDDRTRLQPGDWVEFVDDGIALEGPPRRLVQVKDVSTEDRRVTLFDSVKLHPPPNRHPLLRRWSLDGIADTQTSHGIAIPAPNGDWLTLEDGVEIQFGADRGTPAPEYRAGDHWVIPARVATGDVEWPGRPDNRDFAPPRGVQHWYAPLALLSALAGQAISIIDLRLKFDSMAHP